MGSATLFTEYTVMFVLRSKTIRNLGANFPKMFSSLQCPICKSFEDTQEHVLLCSVLLNILPRANHIEYGHMRGTADQQTDFLRVYEGYLRIRDELLDSSGLGSSLPGLYAGPVLPQSASTGRASGNGAASVRITNSAVAVSGE